MTSLPMVFLHGWGLHGGVWAETANGLAGRAVLTPDLAGYGESAMCAPYQADALANRLAETMPDACIVVGWSMGGLVAQAWAARRPEQVRGLVLVGGTPAFVARPDWPYGLSADLLAGFAEALLADRHATLLRFLALQARGGETARAVIGRLRERLFERPEPGLETLRAGLDLLRETDLRALAATIRCPTLVVHGGHDTLCPLTAGHWLAEHLPDAELAVHPHAAHAPFLSHPDWFMDRLMTFSARIGQ